MTFKALLAASILLAPALAHAEGHANIRHTWNLQRCMRLTPYELELWGRACRTSLHKAGWDGSFTLTKGVMTPSMPEAGTPSDLSDNKNELPNRGTAHGDPAAKGAVAVGHIGPSVADMQLGTISAHMIGAVTAATIHNAMITRANQAAYVAAHPAPQPAKTPAPVPAVSPKSPAPPTTKTNPQPPSQPATPPSKPSKPSVPSAPPSKPSPPAPPSAPPAPPSKPVPPAPPVSPPVPPAPPVHHHPAPPPSHLGNPGHGGQGGCSGRGK